MDKESDAVSDLRARLASLSAYVRETECTAILRELSASGSKSYTYTSEILSTDDLLKLGFSVLEKATGKLLIFMHPASCTCLLFSSGDVKCGKLIKDHAKGFGGRGGGRDDNARAMFGSVQDMKRFAKAAAEMVE